ncbi:vexin [Rhea pennata]|uniref:vexin n=1 Tax=Rhea pennata TaxID=8795 RepID=UPI002E272CA3
MHQIYSCSDENLEVFTTVISSKSCSPARRRAKAPQHILAKSVIAIADCWPHRPDKPQPHHGDVLQVLYGDDEVRDLGCLQSGQQAPCPAKCTAKHMGISEQESSKSCDHQSDRKSSFPASSVTHIAVKQAAATELPTDDSTFTEDQRQRLRKTTEYDLTLPPGAEASLPLTGGNLCGTPSLLRKMLMKHKKKSEYLGATNSAFEAD